MQIPRRPGLSATLAAITAAAGSALLLIVFSGTESSADPLRVEVFAKQYSWSFGYPTAGNAYSEDEFHLPVGQPVVFTIHTADVVHGFWVPEWEVKLDTIPGAIEEVEVTPEDSGAYQLVCSVGCGILHTAMRAKIVVEEPARYRRWLSDLDTVPAPLQKEARLDRELRAIEESLGGA